jgi:hypothetical protein
LSPSTSFFCILCRQLGVVLVVERDQPDLAAVDTAGIVDFLEVRQRAVADVVAEVGVAAGQRGGLADNDIAGVRRQADSQKQCEQQFHVFLINRDGAGPAAGRGRQAGRRSAPAREPTL